MPEEEVGRVTDHVGAIFIGLTRDVFRISLFPGARRAHGDHSGRPNSIAARAGPKEGSTPDGIPPRGISSWEPSTPTGIASGEGRIPDGIVFKSGAGEASPRLGLTL